MQSTASAAPSPLPGGVLSAVQLHTLSVDLAASLTDSAAESNAAAPRSWHSVTFPTYAAVRRTLTDIPPPSTTPPNAIAPTNSATDTDTDTTTTTTTTTTTNTPNSISKPSPQLRHSPPSHKIIMNTTSSSASDHKHTPSPPPVSAQPLSSPSPFLPHQNSYTDRNRQRPAVPDPRLRRRRRPTSRTRSAVEDAFTPASLPTSSLPVRTPRPYRARAASSLSSSTSSSSSSSSSIPHPPPVRRPPRAHRANTSAACRSVTVSRPPPNDWPRPAEFARSPAPGNDFKRPTPLSADLSRRLHHPKNHQQHMYDAQPYSSPTPHLASRQDHPYQHHSPPRSEMKHSSHPHPYEQQPYDHDRPYNGKAQHHSPPQSNLYHQHHHHQHHHQHHQHHQQHQASVIHQPHSAHAFHHSYHSNAPPNQPHSYHQGFSTPSHPRGWTSAASPPPSPDKRNGTSTTNGHSNGTKSSHRHVIPSSTSSHSQTQSQTHSQTHSYSHSSVPAPQPMPLAPMPRGECLAGPLSKRCARSRRMVRRHFVLSDGALSNFRAERDVKPTWTESLVGARVTADLRANRVVVAWRSRRLVLAADTIDDARFWAQALSAAADAASKQARLAACNAPRTPLASGGGQFGDLPVPAEG